MSKKPNIVQLTNDYIDNANQEQRLERAEHEQRNRFMGWILFVVVLLFILPTYNLVETYMNIKQQEKEVLSLQKDYDKLSDQTKERKDLAKKLKDDAFAEKYARAKYYYSREVNLSCTKLITLMKDLLKTVETFLTYSEAKLEELSEKNQQLKTELPRKEEVKKQA